MLAAEGVDFWRFQAHPEVWVLVGGVSLLAAYALLVLGPKVVGPGNQVIRRSQVGCLVVGLALLWLSSDWPVHDVAEQYLFSVHMLQHMLLVYAIPPLLLIATPEWLARVILGRGRAKKVFYALARPIPAAVLFNALQLLTHWTGVVNASTENALLHYVIHTALVASSFLLWTGVCGPLPELRISYPGQMLYLFVTSIIPTVPAGWLTFAEGAVYSAYDIPERMFDVSVATDQQMAGLLMKLVAGGFLWVVIAMRFFQWAARFSDADKAVDQVGPPTDLQWDDGAGPRTDLTWDTVEREFEKHPAPPEPTPPARAPDA